MYVHTVDIKKKRAWETTWGAYMHKCIHTNIPTYLCMYHEHTYMYTYIHMYTWRSARCKRLLVSNMQLLVSNVRLLVSNTTQVMYIFTCTYGHQQNYRKTLANPIKSSVHRYVHTYLFHISQYVQYLNMLFYWKDMYVHRYICVHWKLHRGMQDHAVEIHTFAMNVLLRRPNIFCWHTYIYVHMYRTYVQTYIQTYILTRKQQL